MSKANGTLASKKDISTLVRATFEPGMLLQHEDLDQLNAYTRGLSRLLFRSFFGCGVVCGLVVSTEQDSCGKIYVSVGAGLALGCNGDPIYVPKDQRLPIDERCDQDIDGPLWIVLCGSVRCCGPRTSICSPDDEEPKPVCTRERDCFEIKIVKVEPKCICGCPGQAAGGNREPVNEDSSPDPSSLLLRSTNTSRDCKCADPNDPCYKDHYDGKCGCKCDDDCSCCDCDCVLVAEMTKNVDGTWTVDHGVRRFIRPVLMRDPQIELEEAKQSKLAAKALNAFAKRKMGEQKLQEAINKANVLQEQLRAASERNNQLTAELERIRRREAEQEEADQEKKQKQLGKSSKKKDKEGE